jgi:hypothetical protein
MASYSVTAIKASAVPASAAWSGTKLPCFSARISQEAISSSSSIRSMRMIYVVSFRLLGVQAGALLLMSPRQRYFISMYSSMQWRERVKGIEPSYEAWGAVVSQ